MRFRSGRWQSIAKMPLSRLLTAITGLALVASVIVLTPVGYGTWTDTLTANVTASIADLDVQADIKITPQALNSKSNGQEVKAKVDFPSGLPPVCSLEYVDVGTVMIRVLGEAASVSADRSFGNDKQFTFDRGAVIGLMGGRPGPVDVTLEVSGDVKNGGNTVCSFSGTDTITWDPSGKDDGVTDSTEDSVAPAVDDKPQLPTWLDTLIPAPQPGETPVMAPTPTATPIDTTSETDAPDQTAPDVEATPTATPPSHASEDEPQLTESEDSVDTSDGTENLESSGGEPTATPTGTPSETTP